MSNRMKIKKSVSEVIDKEARKANERIHEALADMAHKIANDQREWLDKQMEDLLPPELYRAGQHGDMEREIEAYLLKHKIKLIWIPDSQSIRIMVGDQIHSQFITKLALDDEPVEFKPTGIPPSPTSNN
jgi:hypothetical protein